MRAWLIDELTGIDRLRIADVPSPRAGEGEVVLNVKLAALNPADRYLAENLYPAHPKLPHILGRDAVGFVADENGKESGERKAVLRGPAGGDLPGTFAEQVVIPRGGLAKVPDAWSDEEAAGATLVYLTAYQAITMWGAPDPGSILLVTGASGGVGVASVQLGAAMGLHVIGLSRSVEKGRRLIDLGASAVLNPESEDWHKELKTSLAPRRVHLAIDNIGGKLLPRVIDTLGDNGKVSLVGRLAGPVPSFNTATMFFRRLRMGGVAVGAYTQEEAQQAWARVLDLMAAKGFRPIVDNVFPFEKLPEAFERLAQGPMGKVVLRVRA